MKTTSSTQTIMSKNYLGVKMEMLIDQRYQLKDGTYKICLRIYNDRKYTYIPTGHHAASVDNIDRDVYASLESKLNRYFERYKDEIDNDIFSIKNLDKTAEKDVYLTLNELVSARIDRMRKEGKHGTATHWNCMLKSLNVSVGNLPWKQVSPRTIQPFVKYIQGKYNVTTQAILLNDLKAAINESLYHNYIKPCQTPFKINYYDNDPNKIIVPKSNKRTERYLTKDEMTAIYNQNLQKPSYYTCLFFLCYLMGGINVADLVKLKFDDHYWNNDCKELAFVRTKTANKQDWKIRLAITDKIRQLFDLMGVVPAKGKKIIDIKHGGNPDYYVSRINQDIADRTQTTAKKVGINKKITPTYARHSFATIANRLQLPYNWIEYTMGHSNNSVSSHYMGGYTTQQLIEFTDQLL